MIKKTSIHFIGLMLMAFGIALIVMTGVGASPYDALSDYLRQLIGLRQDQLGYISILNGVVMTIIVFCFKRDKRVFIGILFLFAMGLLINLSLTLISHFDFSTLHIVIKYLIAFAGLFILAFGTVLTINSGLPASTVEQAMLLLHQKIKNLSIAKIVLDVIFLVLAIVVGLLNNIKGPFDIFQQINAFTIVMMFGLGPVIDLLNIKRKGSV